MNAADTQGMFRPPTQPVTRLLDRILAAIALILVSPIMLVAAIGIKLTSPGPILYRARRIARDRRSHRDRRGRARESAGERAERRREGYWGREFTLFKFRTMNVATGGGAPITAQNDSRIFRFGGWLRATKIDELPQLFNVIRGDMALVGPRPEAPEIVRLYYTPDDLSTLQVQPGLTSPGTLYYYTHGETTLNSDGVVDQYVQTLLPLKLTMDRAYIRKSAVAYDLKVILRTVMVIVGRIFGKERFPDPPELEQADRTRTARP